MRKPKYWLVGVYQNHRWVADLKFKHRWTAVRVHKLISRVNKNSDVMATIVKWYD